MYPSVLFSQMGIRMDKPVLSGGLPADLLYVVIAGDGEFLTSTLAAALEDLASVRGRHTGAKSMHPNTSANPGLVCPFGHHIFLSN